MTHDQKVFRYCVALARGLRVVRGYRTAQDCTVYDQKTGVEVTYPNFFDTARAIARNRRKVVEWL